MQWRRQQKQKQKISRHSPFRNSTTMPSGLKIKMSQFLWVGGRRVENFNPQINIWIQQLQIWTSNTTISMNPSLFSHPSQNYNSLACTPEHMSNSSWHYYSIAPKTEAVLFICGFPTAPKAGWKSTPISKCDSISALSSRMIQSQTPAHCKQPTH